MMFVDVTAEEPQDAVHVVVPNSEPARSLRQKWKSDLAEFLSVHEGTINMLTIVAVLIDLGATIQLEVLTPSSEKVLADIVSC
jgi:hypothetical protein